MCYYTHLRLTEKYALDIKCKLHFYTVCYIRVSDSYNQNDHTKCSLRFLATKVYIVSLRSAFA